MHLCNKSYKGKIIKLQEEEPSEEEPSEEIKKPKKKVKKPKTATTKDGKQIEIIEDDEPSEIIIDKKTGKKVKKKKIRNEDGDIEELKEIVEDIPTEYDEETGEK